MSPYSWSNFGAAEEIAYQFSSPGWQSVKDGYTKQKAIIHDGEQSLLACIQLFKPA